MQLTFVNDLGQSYSMDIDPGMELENVMALLEAEVCLCYPILSLGFILHGSRACPSPNKAYHTTVETSAPQNRRCASWA